MERQLQETTERHDDAQQEALTADDEPDLQAVEMTTLGAIFDAEAKIDKIRLRNGRKKYKEALWCAKNLVESAHRAQAHRRVLGQSEEKDSLTDAERFARSLALAEAALAIVETIRELEERQEALCDRRASMEYWARVAYSWKDYICELGEINAEHHEIELRRALVNVAANEVRLRALSENSEDWRSFEDWRRELRSAEVAAVSALPERLEAEPGDSKS